MLTRKNDFAKRKYLKRKHPAALMTTGNILLDPLIMLKSVRSPKSNGHTAGSICDFIVVNANHAACRNTHLPKEKMIGLSLLGAMPGHLHTRLFEQYCQVVESGQPLMLDGFIYEDTFRGKLHQYILDIRGTKQGDGLALTWRDVTQARQVEADLVEVKTNLVQSIETERKNLAAILHDGPVQDLYAIDFQLHELAYVVGDSAVDDDNPQLKGVKRILEDIQEQLHGVIETLMGTVGELRPTSLIPFGLRAAITSHIDRFREDHPKVQVTLRLDEDGQRLASPLRLGLYRIYEQAVENIARHTCATQIGVRLTIDDQQVALTVEDNGEGFQAPERWVTLVRAGHLGLARASDQAQRLGGVMTVQSKPGQGTQVYVRIPLN